MRPGETRKEEDGAAPPRAVVVHGGARDNYQLATALQQRGMLEVLVTDLFWPQDAWWAMRLWPLLPTGLRTALHQRSKGELPVGRVKQTLFSGLFAYAAERLPWVPFAWKRAIRRWSDGRLGRLAGNLARRRGVGLVSYSYYGYHAFQAYGRPGILFQLHPQPEAMQAILQQELEDHPECAASLLQEWELALPAQDLERLVAESHSAKQYLVASSFTRQTLVERGVAAGAIEVIPYGVDLQHYHPSPVKAAPTGTLHLLFVGRINQRKGLSYLLSALRLLEDCDVHLTICGRVLDNLSTFREFERQVTIRPSVSSAQLLLAYQAADLFVFPSVGEGFGQVLLEAMACGLPILASTHTAAPDLIAEGVQGFCVEPRDPVALANRIRWACRHREELTAMGKRARLQAEQFPWDRFQRQAAHSVARGLSADVGAGR